MIGRRWMTGAVCGTVAVTLAGAGWAWKGRSGSVATITRATASSPANGEATAHRSPLQTLAEAARTGDPQAVAALFEQSAVPEGKTPTALTEAEAKDWIVALDGLRAGFLKFSPLGRATAILTTTRTLNRLRVEPAPPCWETSLHPSHSIYLAGIADNHVEVRATALTEVSTLWNWIPGRAMTPAEELTVAEWKEAFREPAVRRLGDRDPKGRTAAVVCVGSAPLDVMAALASPYLDDPDSGGVRYHTLKTLASRPSLLSEEAILRRLHDTEPGVPQLAEIVLRARGLTPNQIYLGRQMYDPRPEVRVSVIPVILERTDIDPVVWLLQLSHDTDETVRAKAAESLAGRSTPEVLERLREMASSDPSPVAKSAAKKVHALSVAEATATLPPLPGATNLNLKAN